jgi:hypothetical protein
MADAQWQKKKADPVRGPPFYTRHCQFEQQRQCDAAEFVSTIATKLSKRNTVQMRRAPLDRATPGWQNAQVFAEGKVPNRKARR